MNLSAMKFADKYAGWILCAVLTGYEKIASHWSGRTSAAAPPRKILVMKYWGLGSIILASPLIKSLREAFPSSEISFLTLERNRSVAESLNIAERVFTFDTDRGFARFVVGFFAALAAVRRQKFDVCLDLEFFTRFSAVVTYMSGAKRRVGYHSFSVWRGDLHNEKVPFNRYWHVVENFCNIGRRIAPVPETIPPPAAVRVAPDDAAAADALLVSLGVREGDTLICMHANASDLALERRWPYRNFAALCEMIGGRNPAAKILFIGTKSENDSIEQIKKMIAPSRRQSIINIAGRLNIRGLAHLLKKCAFAVCNDSGPLHLAWALGVKTVSLFGPETPVIYGPRGAGHIVFFKNIDCSPCVNVHDGKSVKCSRLSPECLEKITPEEVFGAITEKVWL